MNRDDIIRMAREAGATQWCPGWHCATEELERFAVLVAAAERESCAKICDKYAKANEESDIMAAAFDHCAAEIRGEESPVDELTRQGQEWGDYKP